MKLLLITAIEEYDKDIKNILKHSGVKSFSVQSVEGYQNHEGNYLNTWFVGENIATDSLLFTVFTEKECLENIYEDILKFNQKQEINTKIHLATVNLENSIF